MLNSNSQRIISTPTRTNINPTSFGGNNNNNNQLSYNAQSNNNVVTNTNVSDWNQVNVMVPVLAPWFNQLRKSAYQEKEETEDKNES